MAITRESSIEEIFASFPEHSLEIAEELRALGLGCIGCSQAAMETLEEGLQNHGLSEEQIEEVIEKLNKIVAEK